MVNTKKEKGIAITSNIRNDNNYRLIRYFICSLVILLLMVGCKSNVTENSSEEAHDEKTEEIIDNNTSAYPIILSDEERDNWIATHSGRYRCEEKDSFTTGEGLGIDISIHLRTEEDEHNIYQITCCVNDGVVYDIESITQEDEFAYALHLRRITVDDGRMQNVTLFPTDTYLIQLDQSDNDALRIQFAGVYNNTLDSFNGDIENGSWFKNFPQFYKNEDEWYDFRRVDYYIDLDECQRIADECFKYYYRRDVRGFIDSDERGFIIWCVEVLDDGKYIDSVHFIQYKSNIHEVFHDIDLIWSDGKPVGNKTAFGGGIPYSLIILSGPIRIRKEHNTNSEMLGSVKTNEEYWYFDEYEDDDYIWYKIYVPKTNSYAWIASSKAEPWIGKLA